MLGGPLDNRGLRGGPILISCIENGKWAPLHARRNGIWFSGDLGRERITKQWLILHNLQDIFTWSKLKCGSDCEFSQAASLLRALGATTILRLTSLRR